MKHLSIEDCQYLMMLRSEMGFLTVHGIENNSPPGVVSVSGQDFVGPGEHDRLYHVGKSRKICWC